MLVPLALAELPNAATAMPIALVEQNNALIPAALVGLLNGQNLFVSRSGEWLGRYIPAVYKTYPFKLAATDNEQLVLCVDETTGLVNNQAKGEQFFDADGQPSIAIQQIIDCLKIARNNHFAAASVCAALKKYNLVQPWPLTIETQTGTQPIQGLFRIEENALNSLPADSLFELRNNGALLVAYLQLLSSQHLGALTGLAFEAASKAASDPDTANGTIVIGETFSFGNI